MVVERVLSMMAKQEKSSAYFFLEVNEADLIQQVGIAIILLTEDNQYLITNLPAEDIGKSDIVGQLDEDSKLALGLESQMFSLVTGRLSDKPNSSPQQAAASELAEELDLIISLERLSGVIINQQIAGFQILGLETNHSDPDLWVSFVYSDYLHSLIGFFQSKNLSQKQLEEKVNEMIDSGELQMIQFTITHVFKLVISAAELQQTQAYLTGQNRKLITLTQDQISSYRSKMRPLTYEILKSLD